MNIILIFQMWRLRQRHITVRKVIKSVTGSGKEVKCPDSLLPLNNRHRNWNLANWNICSYKVADNDWRAVVLTALSVNYVIMGKILIIPWLHASICKIKKTILISFTIALKSPKKKALQDLSAVHTFSIPSPIYYKLFLYSILIYLAFD